MKNKLVLSSLGHTWFIDLDGTIVKHNGYKMDGKDTLLEGAKEFLCSIPKEDMIVLITSREESCRDLTISFLRDMGIPYDHIIFGAPYGERIVVNDAKPSGLVTGYAILMDRDSGEFPEILMNDKL